MATLPALPTPEQVNWKPGAVSKDGGRALALAYVDSRDVYDALDAAGVEWHTEVVSTIADGKAVHVTVKLEIDDVIRTDVGTDTDAPSAFAQAVKRAAAQHGLYRGLYRLDAIWAEYDNVKKQFTPAALQRLSAGLRRTSGNLEPIGSIPHPQPAQPRPSPRSGADSRTAAPLPAPQGNGAGHRHSDGWRNDWTTPKHYPYAMDWGRHSGKFGHERHFSNAWGKLFKQYEAHKPENAGAFLEEWHEYVTQHESAAS